MAIPLVPCSLSSCAQGFARVAFTPIPVLDLFSMILIAIDVDLVPISLIWELTDTDRNQMQKSPLRGCTLPLSPPSLSSSSADVLLKAILFLSSSSAAFLLWRVSGM